jgi:sugar lactone lactonase YvrE
MKVDVKGNVWSPARVECGSSIDTGNRLGTINLIEHAANFAWGDADFSTLYFCGRSSIYKLKMKAKDFVPYVAYAKPEAP